MALYENRKILLCALLIISACFSMIGSSSVPFEWERTSLGIIGVMWLWGSVLPYSLTAVRISDIPHFRDYD